MANPAINVALIAAAAQQENAAKAIRSRLHEAGATSAARAIHSNPKNATERKMLERLLERGTVRQTTGGRFYLDLAREQELKASARTVALIILAGLLSALASLVAFVATR